MSVAIYFRESKNTGFIITFFVKLFKKCFNYFESRSFLSLYSEKGFN